VHFSSRYEFSQQPELQPNKYCQIKCIIYRISSIHAAILRSTVQHSKEYRFFHHRWHAPVCPLLCQTNSMHSNIKIQTNVIARFKTNHSEHYSL